jgi:hypothetical protein
MKIVFVVLVNFQEYVLDNIENCRRFGNHDITVIANESFRDKFDCEVIAVESLLPNFSDYSSTLEDTFRNGFYPLTSLRFRALHEYMLKHNVTNVMHLENDVMVFKNFNDYKFHCENKILITMDAIARCVPGLVYIPNGTLLLECYENFDHSKSDMYNWAYCFHNLRSHVDTLPIYVSSHKTWDSKTDKWDYQLVTNQYDYYNGIFDAAAIGQYLGGIDPRNNPEDSKEKKAGYVSEDCIINYSHHKIRWVQYENYKKPVIVIDDRCIPIFNLHVHCKNLRQFM